MRARDSICLKDRSNPPWQASPDHLCGGPRTPHSPHSCPLLLGLRGGEWPPRTEDPQSWMAATASAPTPHGLWSPLQFWEKDPRPKKGEGPRHPPWRTVGALRM